MTDCIIFDGPVDSKGYGRRKAHRKAYEKAYGPIPPGMCVCHTCDVRNCVNPEHLWLGTQLDNHKDRIKKMRCPHGEKSRLAKLTNEIVLEIRASGLGSIEVATMYSISRQNAWRILNRKTWRHI